MSDKKTVQCNQCMNTFYDEIDHGYQEFHLPLDKDDFCETLVKVYDKEEDEWFDGCPYCCTDGYLMDI